jgi:hypothetical protein
MARKPLGPPVYRPQTAGPQRKPDIARMAPPVYRPAAGVPPGAPPVYRPQAAGPQRKADVARMAAPPVYRPAPPNSGSTAPAVPSPRPMPGTSRLVQPKLKYGDTVISNEAELRARFPQSFPKDQEWLFFTASEARWKKLKIGKTKRTDYMKERWEAMKAMLASSTEFPAGDFEEIRTRVAEFQQLQLKQKAEEEAARKLAIAAPSASAAPPALQKLTSEHVRGLATYLLSSGKAFPEEEIVSVAKKADLPGGRGFAFELEIACKALQGAARKGRTVKVQLGAMSTSAIQIYLNGEISARETEKHGRYGADVTVWTLEAGKWNGKFIQAKSVVFHNVESQVEAAMNQLEGRNADPSANHGAAAAEHTMIGPKHRGKIAVEVTHVSDAGKLEKAAASALNSAHVKSVTFVDPTDSGKYRFPPKQTAKV